MAFFARDILGGCCKRAKFARHFGKFTSDFFRATFEEVLFDGLVARDIYGRFSGGNPSVRHFSSLLLCGTFRYHQPPKILHSKNYSVPRRDQYQ